MKNSLIYISWFIFIFYFSCDDSFLDRPPLDAIGAESYWNTSSDLENYIIQFYQTLPTHRQWDNGIGYEINNSDNMILATPNAEMNGDRGIIGGRWVNDWANVRGVNIFFDNYRKCQDEFESYKHFLGEAHFFRAWYYFELVKKYGDVPWVNTQLFSDSEEQLYGQRENRTIIVDSILNDLYKAKDYLKYRSEVGNLRINKEVALAFISRISLYEGTWQKYHAGTEFGTPGADPNKYFQVCIEATEELLGEGYTVGLHPDYYEMFGADDMSGNPEVFMYRAYSISDGFSNDMQYSTITRPGERGVTWSLVSQYLGVDNNPIDYSELAEVNKGNDFLSQLEHSVDPRFKATIWTPGALMVASTNTVFGKPRIDGNGLTLNTTGFQIKKGSNPYSPGAGQDGGGNSETGYIYFRYGEVLLNYAEALFESTGEVAYEALNKLRSRVGMPDFSVNNQLDDPNWLDYGYSISNELYEIRRERRVELALEGHRANDYKRWAAHMLFKGQRPKGYPFKESEFPNLNPSLDENGLIDFFQQALDNGYQFRENQDYLSPIPSEEITLNPNLTQNPGW